MVLNVHLIYTHAYARSWQMMILCVSHQKKSLPNIYGICVVGGKSHSSPLLVLTRLSYANVVSVPAKEHNIHIAYITTYPPSGAYAFNTAWTALHMLRECIHVLKKRPHDILRSTRLKCAVMTSRLMDTHASSWGDGSRIHITRW
jgi:hypothetical protein